MDESNSNNVSPAKAVLLGALASGVNGPTWSAIKISFLMFGACLAAMLALAFSSHDFVVVGHVLLLVVISAVLFALLNGFLAQIGLVSVEQQMKEMGLSEGQDNQDERKKT